MSSHDFKPFAALVFGALITWLAAVSLPMPQSKIDARERLQWTKVFRELEKECDPNSVSNNYEMAMVPQPTEWARERLLAEIKTFDRAVLDYVLDQRRKTSNREYEQMLTMIAVALGDERFLKEAALNMVYSECIAVRICTARELRRQKKLAMVEWFQVALKDGFGVRNDGCGFRDELYYPVRVIAELGLKDLDVSVSVKYN